MNPIRINFTGCALMDKIYPDISFRSEKFRKYASLAEGDGGLSPGKLVFSEEIEKFSGQKIQSIIGELTGNSIPLRSNIGGPAIVPAIHTSQLLGNRAEVKYFGAIGKDPIAGEFLELLQKTPLSKQNLLILDGQSPFTDVLTDPSFDRGHGERCFINNIGVAWNYLPESIPDHFFDADIVCFGGTALVPEIHDHLNDLLEKAIHRNCFTIVNTVYDFRNEKEKPGKPWPLADGRNINLLIMDSEESLKISGTTTIPDASEFFISRGYKSFIITNGSRDIISYSSGEKNKGTILYYPVSNMVKDLIERKEYTGDTTGCGDNFCGGVIYSIASQFAKNNSGIPDMEEAIVWGIASGGFACSYMGGCYFEEKAYEKKNLISEIVANYRKQTGIAE